MVGIATMVVAERVIDIVVALELIVVDIAHLAVLTVVTLAGSVKEFVMIIVVLKEVLLVAIAVVV